MGSFVSKRASRVDISSDNNDNTRPTTIERSQSEDNQMSRRFWWSPKKSVVQIYDENVKYPHARAKINSLSNIDYRNEIRPIEIYNKPIQWNASPRIDSLSNSHWTPSTGRVFIQHEKLKWNAQPRVNSLDNVDYKSSGGEILPVYHEKLSFKHVQPRINTGFID